MLRTPQNFPFLNSHYLYWSTLKINIFLQYQGVLRVVCPSLHINKVGFKIILTLYKTKEISTIDVGVVLHLLRSLNFSDVENA